MKMKSVFWVFLLTACFPLQLFAQQVKVLDVSGEVLVKQDPTKSWENLKVKTALNKNAQLQTKQNAYCTLAFDEKNKNIVTIKENTQVRVESIKPGNIILSQGRVFAAIKNLSVNEKFEIRTPVSISGVRGTFYSDAYDSPFGAQVKTYEGVVYNMGWDKSGNSTGTQELGAGNSLSVGVDGNMGQPRRLSDADYAEYNDFRGYVGDITGGGQGSNAGGGAGGTGGNTGSGLGDSRQDQRDDQRNNAGEESRKEKENSDQSGDDKGGGYITGM